MTRKQVDKQAIIDMMELCPGAVLVGGTVRSLLLGVPLSNDIDLLVASSKLTVQDYCGVYNLEVLKLVPDRGGLEGAGTAKCYSKGFVFDVTVTSQQIRANMLNRDFTVNAMWLSKDRIETGQFSIPADVSTGSADAAAKVLDAPGGDALLTLLYDPCRVVRAMRLRMQLSDQCSARWRLGHGIKRVLRTNSYDIARAILDMGKGEAGQARLRNEMTKFMSYASAKDSWGELQSMPEPIVLALLEASGGKLALKGS